MFYKNIDVDIMRKLITNEEECNNVMEYLKIVDENTREQRRLLIKIGTERAKKNNVKIGRPTKKLPEDFFKVSALAKHGRIPSEKAYRILKMARSSFYKKQKQYEKEIEECYKEMIEEKERVNGMKIEDQMKQLGISVEDIDNTTEADSEVILDAEDVSEREAL